jgi:hypothetical protein
MVIPTYRPVMSPNGGGVVRGEDRGGRVSSSEESDSMGVSSPPLFRHPVGNTLGFLLLFRHLLCRVLGQEVASVMRK